MRDEQYTRTKGETIVVIENPSRNADHSPDNYGPRKRVGSDWIPYREYRLLQMLEKLGVSRNSVSHHIHHKPGLCWHSIKVALVTLVAAPIVIVELGLLLRFLLNR